MKWLRKYVEAITADTYTYVGLMIAYFTLSGSAKKVTGLLIVVGSGLGSKVGMGDGSRVGKGVGSMGVVWVGDGSGVGTSPAYQPKGLPIGKSSLM